MGQPRQMYKRKMSGGTKAGWVFLALVGVIVAGWLLARGVVWKPLLFYVEFDDVKGLKVGDSVYLQGVDIGEIVGLDVIVHGPVRVGVKVDRAFRGNVRSGCEFVIRRDSFVLGKKSLHMLIVDENSPSITPGQVFQGTESTIELYVKKGKDVLKRLSEEARAMVEEWMAEEDSTASEEQSRPID